MNDAAARILIIDDDPIIRSLVEAILQDAGHLVMTAHDATDGLSQAFTELPDLILLDRRMPDKDGLEVLATLRASFRTRDLPIVMLTADGDVTARVDGLRAGADDYIVKPFDADELAARVGALLRRTRRDVSADPLTKLPGNQVLRDELARRLRGEETFALLYADLNHFKPYVDRCGFERASQVIRRLGQIFYNALMEHGKDEDFVGHIGGDDFLLLASPERGEQLAESVVTLFTHLAPTFYDAEDAERGFFEAQDRYGTQRRFSLLGISIAVAHVEPHRFESQEGVAAWAAACKDDVKRRGGSTWASYHSPVDEPFDVTYGGTQELVAIDSLH